MKTTVLVFVDRENTSMGMRIASQEEFTQILIKNKELPLQERRLFTKDVIADTDGLDVMYIETGLPDYQKWNSKQTYRNKIQNAKRKYKFLSTDTLCANEDAGDLTDFIADSFCVEKAVVEKETMRQLRAALENWKPWANEVLRFYLNGRKHMYSTHENVAYNMKKVPIWEKYALSLSEAAEYFHIGTRRLRQIIAKDKYAKYLIWNGGRVFFKRKMFEEYLNNEV